MQRVVFNQKGGVGKTTIACNLAAISALHGKDTVVLDLDPQANATRYLLGPVSDLDSHGAVGFFQQLLDYSWREQSLDGFLTPTIFENLRVLAAGPELADLEDKLESRYKMMKLRETLSRLDPTVAVFVDTPPAFNFFSRSALIAAHAVLIPFDCDDFSRQALYSLMNNIAEIRTDHNPTLEIEGIIVNQFQPRAKLPRQLVQELKAEGLPVLDAYLSSSVKIRESHTLARPMPHLDPKHKLSTELAALYELIDGADPGE